MSLKFRYSKKILFLAIGGIVVLGGGSGTAAIYIGSEKLLGSSYLEINGLECATVETVKVRRNHHYWVRKYVTSEVAGDGIARVRTALRVARSVQQKEKADLVQVTFIDKAGPTERARMRGRMIGAQVVFIPDPSRMPAQTGAQPYSAYYLDGAAGPDGGYYGMRIDLPLEDIEAVSASLTDNADCLDPVAETVAREHGTATARDGQEASGGHAETGEHGAEGHGESEGRGDEPVAEGRAKPADEDVGPAHAGPRESGGFLSSVMELIVGPEQGASGEHASDQQAAGSDVIPKEHDAAESPREPNALAEGGKRWSKATDADERRSDTHAETADARQPSPADGASAADAAGAEWLAKMRGEPAPAAAAGR